jgi:hypothetical protein
VSKQEAATMTNQPDEMRTARKMWKALEPYHALIYFAPEAREAYAASGLKGYWMGYFGSRASGAK